MNTVKVKVKVHLGCGTNIVKGWDNLDLIEKKGIIYHDLAHPLPYKDNTVDMIFTEHVIEHLAKQVGQSMLTECYRVLKPGGSIRVGWPDFAKEIRAYNLKSKAYKTFITPHVPKQMTGTYDELFSDILFSWEHRYAYTPKHMKLLLTALGFSSAKKKMFGKSDYGFYIDVRDDMATVYVEAKK